MLLKNLLFLFFLIVRFSVFAQNEQKIQALHLINYTSDKELEMLIKKLPLLSSKGINTLFLEVDYFFEFSSYPDLAEGDSPITKAEAKRFANECKKNNIRLIPEFQSIGHQSWKENTFGLLKKYPEFDLTPNAFPGNDSIYCREWDVTNPKVNEIIFSLIDEIVDAFEVDAIHLGMDEIFLLGNKFSPNTFGKDPAKLLALAINEFHDHFVKEKKLQLFIWGDRLIDASLFNYGTWEAAANGTAAAIDMIPKDIVICDWHYNFRTTYPSVELFLNKGFSVLPCSFKEVAAANALIKYSYALQNPNMLGHCFTVWGSVSKEELLDFSAMNEGLNTIIKEKYYDVFASYSNSMVAGEIAVQLKTNKKELSIYYTLDGTSPTPKSLKYTSPILITSSCELKAMAFNLAESAGNEFYEEYNIHKGIGKEIKLVNQPSKKYPATNGANTLVNALRGSANFADGQWLGFEGEDIEAIITTNNTPVNYVEVTFFNLVNAWIHHAEEIAIYSSDDGKTFTLITQKKQIKVNKQTVSISLPLNNVKTKYLKIIAKKVIIPEGFNGEGNAAWLFLDEIILN